MRLQLTSDGARVVPARETAEAVLDALVEFCWRRGTAACYRQWPILRVRQYVRFHLAQGTLAWTRLKTFGRTEICAVAVAWQDEEAALRRVAGGDHAFAWRPTNPAGDCVFVAEVVARRPGALAAVIGALARRFPHWRTLKILTFRRGKLVEYPQRVVDLILRKHAYEPGI